MWIPWRRCC
uniref:Uncharacterized protein n=1 Tax=Arundo donax TaxID=35708 RepID=A0A0A9ETN5_ARUDO